MPRSLIIGNGSTLATFDDNAQMRDLYYPYVGMEDHTKYGDVHRVGVWVEDIGFSWFSDPEWECTLNYRPETLVTHSLLRNEKLGLVITSEDYVHPVKNILVRNFRVVSTDGKDKNVKFFFNHDFHIYGDKQKDTAFFEPYTNSVIHYRQRRYFLVGGNTSNPYEQKDDPEISEFQSMINCEKRNNHFGINSYSIGKSEYQGKEGTWKDAEDGELSMTTIDQGSVDSTVGIFCSVSPNKESEINMWVCLGKSLEEVVDLQNFIQDETPENAKRNCHNYWKSWVNKSDNNFGTLDKKIIDLYKRSLLTIRMHADNNGGIVAAADADIMAFNKDTYTYVWPRDGAFVSLALDKAGYMEVTRRFFEFCVKTQSEEGYMLHKFNPDGSYGSSWHPWFNNNSSQLPIQEDETALVLYAMWKHFEHVKDFEFIQYMYENFVKKAAEFLYIYTEEDTGLPLPSYDPWEEHRGVFTYTTACTIAGLHAASKMCHILGHYNHEEKYQDAADKMKQALLFHLFDEEKGRFVKKIDRENGKTTNTDYTIDASVTTVWKLGILSPEDPRSVSTMNQLVDSLTVNTPIGGIARYTDDYYHSVTEPTNDIPGNPWIITTLWKAQWNISRAKDINDLKPAKEILSWVESHATKSGMLPEQLNPFTGQHLSVSPLTWSHATFVETVIDFLEKEKELS
ncbi:glycoside hydrolase family 15 protein [Candidatus Peregrinibacteria bacterium]|jgi:glucoamylase|nr:glycoside hydrolase family 15 protein [Candidatus Peregrinibacteria bacterium]MBT3598576.1 glycoside hydrolase family 15 protein [Candidatus Peregrinibacteria bacterium]MBT4366889.1 glycoside hydrolase family 15 protein [Candidatus Peregrinibacteria bacterium]MBT4586096.1 glycoside hydrolase family 15 protein [Candidatus Peregrinibacteria bacterium]MBT6730571.1 glycoside hydrolase family 15 protein [Candidatus Peregrinibacteria bacterium]